MAPKSTKGKGVAKDAGAAEPPESVLAVQRTQLTYFPSTVDVFEPREAFKPLPNPSPAPLRHRAKSPLPDVSAGHVAPPISARHVSSAAAHSQPAAATCRRRLPPPRARQAQIRPARAGRSAARPQAPERPTAAARRAPATGASPEPDPAATILTVASPWSAAGARIRRIPSASAARLRLPMRRPPAAATPPRPPASPSSPSAPELPRAFFRPPRAPSPASPGLPRARTLDLERG
nr:translation initiation factor IF-2-like [Aegilops tauschii subsp. strangulata]